MGFGNGFDNGADVRNRIASDHPSFKGKTIFDSSQVIRLWAQQSATQPGARNAKATCWFSGPVLYSYHTEIGRFVTTPSGERVVLLSSRKYSVTTSGQQNDARHAVRGRTVYMVDDVDDIGASLLAHRRDLDNELSIVANKKRRPNTRLTAIGHAENIRAKAARLAAAFGYDLDTWPELAEGWASDFDGFAAKVVAANLAKAEARAKAVAEAAAKVAAEWPEKRAEFLAEASRGYWGHWYSFPCLLAISGDNIVTSWGAKFPIAHAVRALRLVCAVRKAGREWTRKNVGPRLGHFHVDGISADGTVIADCHTVEWAAIEHAARKLGLA